MAVEDSKEALTAHRVKVDDEGVSVLHGATRPLVLCDANLEGRVVGGVAVEDLLETVRSHTMSKKQDIRRQCRALQLLWILNGHLGSRRTWSL